MTGHPCLVVPIGVVWLRMCGRYTQTRGPKWLEQEFECNEADVAVEPRYNIAPSQEALVIVCDAGRKLRSLTWGLVPSWTKDSDRQQRIINARADSLTLKPAFRSLFRLRRCLVPADGFFEWLKCGSRKTPVRFVMNDESLFALAGIWDGGENGAFAIITTAANEVVRPVHDRMPVILAKNQYAAWLRPQPLPESVAAELLQSTPSTGLKSYKVNPVVNRVGTDSPDCIQPYQGEETGWLF